MIVLEEIVIFPEPVKLPAFPLEDVIVEDVRDKEPPEDSKIVPLPEAATLARESDPLEPTLTARLEKFEMVSVPA